ncbi:hypothetical protein [Desulfonatronum sp. SC1]|uniref:hypothetical protein n=1 Tax=Desulfonatronum sp. SC1 TaxID=2109626 RepID=UPI000D31F8EF|nr:hypothetical protein [Desulfonatronum sp. SC1]PTN35004.1 hypothetical protein C6366_11820 [Desulfonatronum sp. SC1]
MELNGPLLALAAERGRAVVGGMLNGIVHNLNNPVHALTMQTELLRNALGKDDLDGSRPNLQDKCARLERVAQDLKTQLDVLTWRDVYVTPTRQLIDPVHFGTWLLQFWQSDLLFKHNITGTLLVEPPPPHVQAIPLALTWSLEEPLAALVSALSDNNPQGSLALSLEFGPLSGGGLGVRMTTTPEADEFRALGAEIRHAPELRELTSALGWDWSAELARGVLSVSVAVPVKTA